MTTEVWFRNPDLYVRELVELGVKRLTFDVGYLVNRHLDPMRIVKTYFPTWMDYRVLVIGNSAQGAAEITRGSDLDHPTAIHPVWQYGDDLGRLETLAENVRDRYIILANLPDVGMAASRSFYRTVGEIQADNPQAKLFMHGTYSFPLLFGKNFKYGDFDGRTQASQGLLFLPNGKKIRYEDAWRAEGWINLLGYAPTDMRVARNRCLYTILACLWAAQYFKRPIRFVTKGNEVVDPSQRRTLPKENHVVQMRRLPEQAGDKFLCDTCSLQDSCKLFRTGSVCIVPGSEPIELGEFFKTRDSATIIEGLGELLSTQSARLTKALEEEDDLNKLDPEVTKIINTLFDRGVKLAKLVDPVLAAAGAARIQLTQNNATITASNPQQLMAAVVKELTDQGIALENITPEMITQYITPTDVQSRALNA